MTENSVCSSAGGLSCGGRGGGCGHGGCGLDAELVLHEFHGVDDVQDRPGLERVDELLGVNVLVAMCFSLKRVEC